MNLKCIGCSEHCKFDLDANVSNPLGPTLTVRSHLEPVALSDKFLQLSFLFVLTQSDCGPTPAQCRLIDRKDCSHMLECRQFVNPETQSEQPRPGSQKHLPLKSPAHLARDKTETYGVVSCEDLTYRIQQKSNLCIHALINYYTLSHYIYISLHPYIT
jgi:hypothetical protein